MNTGELLRPYQETVNAQAERIRELERELDRVQGIAIERGTELRYVKDERDHLITLVEAAKADTERLTYIIADSDKGGMWLHDQAWFRAEAECFNDAGSELEMLDPQKWVRAAIDSDRAKKEAE